MENTFEYQRRQSNSMHIPRVSGFGEVDIDESNQFMGLNKQQNKNYSAKVSPFKESNLFDSKQDGDYEQSVPGSTDADSEEDNFESHFDAIDELSEIFDASPVKKSSSVPVRSAPFARPSNPVVQDRQFVIPRCSAPAPRFFEQESENINTGFAFSSGSFKEQLERCSYINQSSPFTNRAGHTTPSQLTFTRAIEGQA